VRLRIARRRFTHPTTWAAAAAVGLILASGGFIFYNTNVLNEYATASDRMERRVEYERRYGRYRGIPQPRLTGTSLHVEIYPGQRKAEIRGTYLLVNSIAVSIDSIHLATASEVKTAVTLDRPAALVLADEDLGHRIYALDTPLQPGDSLRLMERPRSDWPLARLFALLYVRPRAFDELTEMAALPELAESWRALARRRLESRKVEDWGRRLGE
jgi:hypothetical protein